MSPPDYLCRLYTVYSVHYDTRSNWNMVILPNRSFTKIVEYLFQEIFLKGNPFHDVTKMLKMNSTANKNIGDQPASIYVDKRSFVEKTVWGNDWLSETIIFQFNLTPTVLQYILYKLGVELVLDQTVHSTSC